MTHKTSLSSHVCCAVLDYTRIIKNEKIIFHIFFSAKMASSEVSETSDNKRKREDDKGGDEKPEKQAQPQDPEEKRRKMREGMDDLRKQMPPGYSYIFVAGYLPGSTEKHVVTLIKHEKDGKVKMTADCSVEGDLDMSASDKARINQLWEGKYHLFHTNTIDTLTTRETHARRSEFMCAMAHGREPGETQYLSSDRSYRKDNSYRHDDSSKFNNGSLLPSQRDEAYLDVHPLWTSRDYYIEQRNPHDRTQTGDWRGSGH
jgi:hypothetical protein